MQQKRYAIKKFKQGVFSVVVSSVLLGLATGGTLPVAHAMDSLNIAQGKTATQSSTIYGGDAQRAVDGNTNNKWNGHSITHTTVEHHPWWQVDLESAQPIASVRLFNRVEGDLGNRLANFDVILLNNNHAEVARHHVDSLNGAAYVDVTFEHQEARYVRVELQRDDAPLSLAEVEVYRADTSSAVEVPDMEVPNSTAVADYLFGLQYNTTNLLTRRGESISNAYDSQAAQQNGEFVVIEKIKHTLANTTTDLSMNHNSSVFVGALLRVDQGLLENNPTFISIPRNSSTISVDLPGMTSGTNTTTVIPTQSNIQGAINELVSNWQSQYGSTYAIPAKIQYNSQTAYSLNQLKATFGGDFEKVGAPLKIDFEAIHKGEKQVEVVDFKQVYYTTSMDAPENPASVFAPHITVNDLEQRGINEQTPPAYISSVSYGRQMYVAFETTGQTDQLKAAVDATIKGAKVQPGTELERVIKNTKVTAVIIGGNAQGAAKVVTGSVEDLKTLIQEGSNFTPQSPAVPISYKANFLKDNASATVQNNTDYIETKVTSYKDGYLHLHHKGAYVARYYIYWDELGRDLEGNETIRSREWSENGKGKTSGFSTTLQLKGNVRNLRIRVEEATGLAWEPWRTIYNKTDIPLVQNRTITHWGTTLRPKLSEDITNN